MLRRVHSRLEPAFGPSLLLTPEVTPIATGSGPSERTAHRRSLSDYAPLGRQIIYSTLGQPS